MKLSLMTGIVLFSTASLSGRTPEPRCQMPDAKVLRERLTGFEHFVEKSRIVEQVASKNLSALGVQMILQVALLEYDKKISKGMPEKQAELMRNVMLMNEHILLKKLLQDCPDCLEQLIRMGVTQKPTRSS